MGFSGPKGEAKADVRAVSHDTGRITSEIEEN